MPLAKGSSEQTQDANRRELWASYRRKRRIGSTRPVNAAHAERMIEAIVRETARESR